MTPKQAVVLQAIRDLTVNGVAPTFAEIKAHLGLASLSQVHRAIESLASQGRVTRSFATYRSVRVVDAGPSRADMERWSDAEVRRVTLDLHEIGRARGLGRRVAA